MQVLWCSTWAVHIADDFLTLAWVFLGFGAAAAAIAFATIMDRWQRGGRPVSEEEVAHVGVLTAAFFVASLIHIRVGPTSVHLLLNGLLGVVLRWRAAWALPIALLLQAILFRHGGLTTLGVNCCVQLIPAWSAWGLFVLLQRLPWSTRWFRYVLVGGCASLWAASLVYGIALISTNAILDLQEIDLTDANGILLHPVAILAIVAFGCVVALWEPGLEHQPEFPLGLFVGLFSVALTIVLHSIVLVLGGNENWRSIALISFLGHVPIAALEGIILGFVIGFLARVRPELIGLKRRIIPPPVIDSAGSSDPGRNGQEADGVSAPPKTS